MTAAAIDAERLLTDSAGARLALIPQSFHRLTGRELLEHFPPKWTPVRRRKCSDLKDSRAKSDSSESDFARGATPPTAAALWRAPLVILAHGTEADPMFFYGDRLALELFELSAEQLLRTPSRLSAETPDRAERARLLDQVSRRGFIDDYAGVRVSATGRRFRIEQATVWNLIDAAGALHGQAAAFARWTPLD